MSVDAQTAARLDDALAHYASGTRLLGASAAVDTIDGSWSGASGAAGFDGNVVTTCDRFRIYSITKVYTAAIAMQLVEQGLLALDDRVARWYPALPNAERIAIRDLLAHTSGLFDYLGDADVWNARMQAWDHDALIAEAAGHPAAFAPGMAFDYSNTNYLVLGRIIERVTGDTYVAQLHHRILDPLELHETFLEGEDAMTGRLVAGSSLGPEGPHPYEFVHPSLAWSAGGLVATAADVMRFAHALFEARLVGASSLQAMMTAVTLATGEPAPYGLGLQVIDSPWGPYVGKAGGGSCCDFSSWFGALPARGTIVTTLVSTGNVSSFQLATDIIEGAIPRAR